MLNWFIIFYFAYSTETINGKESIKPVIDHEAYICSKYGTYFANQYIECRSDICDVTCDVNGGCYNLTINASLSTSLIIDCNREQSCAQLLVIAPSSDLEMHCTQTEACYSAHIYAQNTSQINVECSSFHACGDIIIEAETMMNELNVNCINDDACYQSDIHCPLYAACNIQCLSQTSCQSMDLFINNAWDNTLNLECSNITECTGVIHCVNNYFISSNFQQSVATGALYCVAHTPGCCPFFDDVTICPPHSDCVVDCSNTTNTTCVNHYIDATNANSLSLQCGAGYGCAKALIECPIRNDTLCNITCHSCSQIFIKPSINSTISCIGDSSCESMLLSLNGNLNQFYVECEDYRACYLASIIHKHEAHGSIDRFNMKCSGIDTCRSMTMDLQMNSVANDSIHYISDEFSLICSGSNVCLSIDLLFSGSIDNVYIQCGDESNYKADVSACSSSQIVHSEGPINALHFACYGDRSFKYGDIYLYGKYIGEFVWDCMSNESVAIDSYSACDRAYLQLEASVDELNITCSGYNTCYDAQFYFGSSSTHSSATINRWNLKCTDDGERQWSDSDQSCLYADIYVYAEKTVKYLDITCDGGEMACYNLFTRLHGNAVIDYWKMDCFNYTWGYGSWNCDTNYFVVDDYSTLSHAIVNCWGGNTVCAGLWIDGYTQTSQTQEIIYNCNGLNTCEGAYIEGRGTLPDVTINCNAVDSCKKLNFDGASMDQLHLNCNASDACVDMTVYCPMTNENGCHMECSTDDRSCKNIAIVAEVDAYPYRYLDLNCPSPETYTNNTSCDAITIGCSQSKLSVQYIYDYNSHEHTCSNTSNIYCCPLNGVTVNPTEHPTAETFNPTIDPTTDPTSNPTIEPTYNPTVEPSSKPSREPTHSSSAPTFNPTIPTQQSIVYPVAVAIQIVYVFEDIPLDLIKEIIEQTIDYVVNTTDFIGSCALIEDELTINKTEWGITIGGEILKCFDETPQSTTITDFNYELKREIIDNINFGTNLIITDADITLDVDVINPSENEKVPSNATYTPIWKPTTISDDTTNIANTFITLRNIIIVIVSAVLFCAVFIYLYRKYKNKSNLAKIIEENMEMVQTTGGGGANATTETNNVVADDKQIESVGNVPGRDESTNDVVPDDKPIENVGNGPGRDESTNDESKSSESGDSMYVKRASEANGENVTAAAKHNTQQSLLDEIEGKGKGNDPMVTNTTRGDSTAQMTKLIK